MREKKFHQMIYVQYGPVKSAIFDFLKGNVYRVDTEELKGFENGQLDGDSQFVQNLENEDLIIEIEANTWIPSIGFKINESLREKLETFELEIEDGVDPIYIRDVFKGYTITGITQYGSNDIEGLYPNVHAEYKEKNFEDCRIRLIQKHEMGLLSEESVEFNMHFNTCWGRKVAIKSNGDISPCIYSDISVGNIKNEDLDLLLSRLKRYWILTKDFVDKCKICELKYFCFDCREISRKMGGDLYSPNPFCKYNPQTGADQP